MTRSLIFGAAMMLAAVPGFAATGPILSSVVHPPMQIGTANVLDANGRIVGAVQRVEVTPEGKPTEVAVSLISNQDRLVVLNADKLRYDADSNQLTAEVSSAQLAALTGPG